ncbi:MAG: DUF4124 domain-containing protein [Nitrosomonadales bacterium]|nr:DUF4124 domain-containing protein [Nitrosomonadales bacterium]
MTRVKILGAGLMLCIAFSAAAARQNKWVDDNGETHYGDVIPPEYANKDNVQIEKGHEVKKKADPSAPKAPEELAVIEQHRKDKALLNTYSNEKEIDLARDRNLQQVEARIDSVKLLQQSAQESLDGYRKEADGLQQAGRKIPASLQSDIAMAEGKVAKLRQDMAAAQEKETAVRASFEADKVRYRELTKAIKPSK